MATGDKKRAVMTDDIDNAQSSYPVMSLRTVDAAPDAAHTNNLISSAAVAAKSSSLAAGMAIIATGNTHAAISKGQYVYIQGHATLAEGMYEAMANIAANGTLSTSNVAAKTEGAANSLKAAIPNVTYFASYNVTGTEMDVTIPYVENFKCFLFGYITRADKNDNGLMMVSIDHLIRYNTEIHIRNVADSTGADYGIVKYKNATTLTLSTSDPGNKFIYILGIRSL